MQKTILAKTICAAACAGMLAACLGLAACGGGGSAASYADGTYTAQSEIWEDEENGEGNGYGVVTVTIKDGKIVEADFQTYTPDGELKGEDYGMVNGHIGNQDFYNKAQKAVAANPEYASKLVSVGNPDGVDVISGATISHGEFVEAAWAALDQAAAAAK